MDDNLTLADVMEAVESYLDNACSEQLVEEKLETNIAKRTLRKHITLYHGTTNKFATKVVRANSVNMGTRLSKPRLSSFWTADKDEAILWAFEKWIHLSGVDYFSDIQNKTILVHDAKYKVKTAFDKFKAGSVITSKDILTNFLTGKNVYLYTLKDAPMKKVGAGQLDNGEYTLDEDVVPTSAETIPCTSLISRLKFVSSEEASRYRGKFDIDPAFGNGRKHILEKLIYRDGQKTLHKRINVYHNANDEHVAGKGKHVRDSDGRLRPDMSRVKELSKDKKKIKKKVTSCHLLHFHHPRIFLIL